MRVLFFITVRGHGRGGHFHSLNHISSALGEKVSIGIFSIGNGRSQIIENNPWFLGHLFFNGRNFFSFKRQINKKIKDFKPDIIHCFDVATFNILALATNFEQNKIVVNKCGGSNPVTFPYIQNLILFSKENEEWFLNNNKFKNSNIYLIPNRVNRKELIINESKCILKKNSAFCFVRIARIGSAYKKSIEVSIELISQIVKSGLHNVHLYIIGALEDESVLKDLKKASQNLPISFLTDDKFTKKASDMLYLADAVIATGRGIMEATALGKPILTPAVNSPIPILVNPSNFEIFLTTNFSQRNTSNGTDNKLNFDNIRRLIDDDNFREILKVQSSKFFEEYFDVNGGVSKYSKVYENAVNEKLRKGSFLINIKYQILTIYSFIKNEK